MAFTVKEDGVWNKYIDKYGGEPTNDKQVFNLSNNKENRCTKLSYSAAREVFNTNQGKGLKYNDTSV